MNQEQNNSTQTNTANTQVQVNLNKVDPRTVQPTVLGELRTEKIGNPSLLFAFIAIITVVLVLLPLSTSMLQDGNSLLYKLVYGKQDQVIDDLPVDENKPLDGSMINQLTSNTILKLDNVIVQNFQLSTGQVDCEIYSFSGLLDLDEKEVYLNIYSSTNEEDKIGYVKLTGDHYDNQPKSIVLYNKELSFNASKEYYGKLIEMTEEDYPVFNVNADELGVGSITCTKDTRSIEYVFQNNYLISMTDTVSYKVGKTDDKTYLDRLGVYQDKATLLGDAANVTEEEEGFTYLARINLSGYEYPKDFKDIDYYKENDVAKIVVYAQIGKGYDCK